MHWTIIGGGLQGTTIALKLKNEGLKNEALTIIDPYSSLCERLIFIHNVLVCHT